jgi:hypothetical protein
MHRFYSKSYALKYRFCNERKRMQSRFDFTELLVYCTNIFDSPLEYRVIEIVKCEDIKTNIVYLVTGYPTHFQLQYNGIWGTGLSVAKISHYGNQNS